MVSTRAFTTALVLMRASTAIAFPVETLRDSGNPKNRLDLVILGDGYRAQDQQLLTDEARFVIRGLLQREPFRDFPHLLNVRLIHSESNEQGADYGAYGAVRDTRYNSTFFCGGIARVLCADDSLALSDAVSHVPEADAVVMLVNEPTLGGSGGQVAVLSVSVIADQVLAHELGHTIAGLADEYEDPYPGFPLCDPLNDCSEPNVTLRASRLSLKWAPWVDASTPIPTPVGRGHSGVGSFEGARYHSSGIYRPVEGECRMRQLGPPFCPVCREALTRSYFDRVTLVDDAIPAAGSTSFCPRTRAVSFGLTLVPVSFGSFSVTWSLNGVLVASTGESLTLSTATLPAGRTSTLVATVEYTSSALRLQPAITTELTWTLEPACPDGGVPVEDAQDAGTPDAGTSSADPDGGFADSGIFQEEVLDAGVPAAQEVDGGSDFSTADAGVHDGGWAMDEGGIELDGGRDVGAGGSNPPSAEQENMKAPAGCGCASSDAGAMSLIAVLVARPRTRGKKRQCERRNSPSTKPREMMSCPAATETAKCCGGTWSKREALLPVATHVLPPSKLSS